MPGDCEDDDGDDRDDDSDGGEKMCRCRFPWRAARAPEPSVSINRKCKASFPPQCISSNLWEFLSHQKKMNKL